MQKILKVSMFIACCAALSGEGIYAADIKIEDACGEVGRVNTTFKLCPVYTLKGQEAYFVDGIKYHHSVLVNTVFFHSYNFTDPSFMCPFTAHIKSPDIVRELCAKLDVSSDSISEYAFTMEDKSFVIDSSTPYLLFRPGWECIRQWSIDDQTKRTKHDGNYSYDAKVIVISADNSVKTYQGRETYCMHTDAGGTLTHSPNTENIFGKDITKEKMESPVSQAMIYYVRYNEGPLGGQSRVGIVFMYPRKDVENLRAFLEKCGTYPISFADVVNTIPIKLRKADDGFLQNLFYKKLEDEEDE